MFALFTPPIRAVLFSATIAATMFAPLEAKAQCIPNLPEISALDIQTDGVSAPQPRVPGSPDHVLPPYSIVVTGDGQTGPEPQPDAPGCRLGPVTDGLARAPNSLLDLYDPVVKSLQ